MKDKDMEKYLKKLAAQVVVDCSKSRIERVMKRIEEEKANSKKQETQTEKTED